MFDLNASILDPEYDEEIDAGRLEEYINGLITEFEKSVEAETVMQEFDTSLGWTATYIHYAANYFSATPATITAGETAEILFEIFPRKVSVEADAAGEIIAELRAFWQFLKRTRSLAQADTILEILTDDDADLLEEELADTSNFGMAKSFFTAGKDAGFDMKSQESMDRFMFAYNASLLERRGTPPAGDEPRDRYAQPVQTAVSPLRNTKRRVGRNEPCPCGSGRKYKKCCGR
ncbi:MAG: SEC-C domain-containing protein [Planctomycetes bacterium]|nr:SEC-C domain-containing protein [Planctomycetota bacterium]